MTKAGIFQTVRLTMTMLAVTTAAAGCGCPCSQPHQAFGAPAFRAPASAAAGDGTVRFGPGAVANANDPGSVNVFGEMKGIKAGATQLVGDSNFQQHTFLDQGYDADVTVDPTGKWLAFASTRDCEHPNIYTQRVDGTAVIQLTSGSADDAYPVFSPDGSHIAFSSTRAGNWQIFTMDTVGKNITQVTTGPLQAIHPSWSPDGTRLVYCSLGSKSNQWELWCINLQTNERRMIGYGLFPSWSPSRDMDRIAFQRPRQRGSRWFGLWTLDLVNGEATRATEVTVSSNAAILSPTWSPDGTRLTFATVLEPTREISQHGKGRTDIWIVNADGTNRQRLTDGTGSNLMPCWSGDRIFFISDRGGSEVVWSARAAPAKSYPFATGAKKDDVLLRDAPKLQNADTREPAEPQ
jgi:TolB protein